MRWLRGYALASRSSAAVQSRYHWQGRVETAQEIQLLFKTSAARALELEQFILDASSVRDAGNPLVAGDCIGRVRPMDHLLKHNVLSMFNCLGQRARHALARRIVSALLWLILGQFATLARAADDFLDPAVAFKFSAAEKPGEVDRDVQDR